MSSQCCDLQLLVILTASLVVRVSGSKQCHEAPHSPSFGLPPFLIDRDTAERKGVSPNGIERELKHRCIATLEWRV